ncbi:MAG TPA: class I SAM-dependent methyltransferase [Anaeromyxobacteraceae bacterium]|nr:class I SAM-dependent methyltransferase [Anaeromyxobacteraceae bacterium]
MRTSSALAREPVRALLPVPDRCVLCGDSRLSLRFPARGEMVPLDAGAWRCTSFGHRHHPPIYGCDDCGLLFQWPMPPADDLERAYASVEDPLYMAERDNRILTFRNVVRTLGPAGGRRLLDVGAYCGYFLEVARESGFRAEGLELSRWAANHARAQGFTVHTEPLEARASAGQRYEVLTLWDVIEHLPDPREELAAARDLLVPGGRLHLSTIDTGSLVARLLGARWPWLMDMHLVYFDRPTISALLEEAGFRVLDVGTYSHTVSSGYLLRKIGASFPALAPFTRALSRVVPGSWPIPVNLGDNMLVSAERL